MPTITTTPQEIVESLKKLGYKQKFSEAVTRYVCCEFPDDWEALRHFAPEDIHENIQEGIEHLQRLDALRSAHDR